MQYIIVVFSGRCSKMAEQSFNSEVDLEIEQIGILSQVLFAV